LSEFPEGRHCRKEKMKSGNKKGNKNLRRYKSERSQGNKMFSKKARRKWNIKEDCRRITEKMMED
jgi:hypothetical protein